VAKLIYSAITSLDGYVADTDGRFDWAEPDEELHKFVNERERLVGTYLYGRRLYDVMVAWEKFDLAGLPPFIRDYAHIWRAAEKIVYSRTLEIPASDRTRIEREFDPEAVRQLKASSSRDITVGGPELATEAFRTELIDECRLYVTPVVIGGGYPAMPSHLRVWLELLDERRFRSGVVQLHYRVAKVDG